MGEKYKFFTPVRVRYADTDAQGHVFFSNYLIYFDQGLTDYLKAIGYGYDELLREGVDFFYVDAQCTYKGSARFDEVLNVHTRLTRIGKTSFTFQFSIHKAETDALIASGRIVAVAVDTETRRPVPVPEGLRRAVEAYEGEPPAA
ncbi:acyl-CoA thioester hydrolase [Desulfacinum hydrothermale DSM 13146]|uniref:Acyl-CoA thioester hydrolase n=1 Tax=Desulfacinum hydrothermale DSM 13146 TaxID=1121390 RepID=A0A1W1XXP6_9BACT|nr:thioesterase family protein [Desulfacinum hydrothermale]SMC28645.1 acyl-CoA thioester hydrolase [Desulfacinum hydrothermale DSM 13146]